MINNDTENLNSSSSSIKRTPKSLLKFNRGDYLLSYYKTVACISEGVRLSAQNISPAPNDPDAVRNLNKSLYQTLLTWEYCDASLRNTPEMLMPNLKTLLNGIPSLEKIIDEKDRENDVFAMFNSFFVNIRYLQTNSYEVCENLSKFSRVFPEILTRSNTLFSSLCTALKLDSVHQTQLKNDADEYSSAAYDYFQSVVEKTLSSSSPIGFIIFIMSDISQFATLPFYGQFNAADLQGLRQISDLITNHRKALTHQTPDHYSSFNVILKSALLISNLSELQTELSSTITDVPTVFSCWKTFSQDLDDLMELLQKARDCFIKNDLKSCKDKLENTKSQITYEISILDTMSVSKLFGATTRIPFELEWGVDQINAFLRANISMNWYGFLFNNRQPPYGN